MHKLLIFILCLSASVSADVRFNTKSGSISYNKIYLKQAVNTLRYDNNGLVLPNNEYHVLSIDNEEIKLDVWAAGEVMSEKDNTVLMPIFILLTNKSEKEIYAVSNFAFFDKNGFLVCAANAKIGTFGAIKPGERSKPSIAYCKLRSSDYLNIESFKFSILTSNSEIS